MSLLARVVVVASDDDLAADMVVRHFRRTTFVRLDPGMLRPGTYVRARVGADDGTWAVGTPVTSETSVWWRKPTRASALEGEARWAADETTMAVLGTLRAAGVGRWMNDPDALDRARPKVPQLTLARYLGFAVPDTLITTNRVEAADFIASGRTVVKALTQRGVEFSPAYEITPAHRLDGIDTPTCFQRLIDKAADLRVTVVGDDLFAARILAGDLDWRVEGTACHFEHVDLDDETARCIRRFMVHAGLTFGAFDFAVSRDGVPWFLECNANGEFGFQEELTAAPITGAIAAWLQRRGTPEWTSTTRTGG